MDYRRFKVPASRRRSLMGESAYLKSLAEKRASEIDASKNEDSSGSYVGVAEFIELSLQPSDVFLYPDVAGYSNNYGWPIYDPRSESQNLIAYYKTSSSSGLSKELEKNYLKVLLSKNSENSKLLRLTVISCKEQTPVNAEIRFAIPIVVAVYSGLNSSLDIDSNNDIKFNSCYGSIGSVEIEVE